MNGLKQWAGNLVCFLILVTMMQGLLPSKKYEKYIRFFAGMVLILLVAQPLFQGLRLEDELAYYFDAISFQNDARDLSREILGMEQQRLQQVFEAYEQAANEDMKRMAEETGLLTDVVQVEIDSDRESESYGLVSSVRMVVHAPDTQRDEGDETGASEDVKEEDGKEKDGKKQDGQEKDDMIRVEVAPIQVETALFDGHGEAFDEGAGGMSETASESFPWNESVSKLRRKVEQYYGLESNQVKIEYKSW